MDIVYSIVDIDKIALALWDEGSAYRIWTFDAAMGSGKTTIISALCKFLGVQDAVSSPTYSIINEYHSERVGRVFHIDLYRLKDEIEAVGAGVEDVLEDADLCFVEWPNIAASLFGDDSFHIEISMQSALERRIITRIGASK